MPERRSLTWTRCAFERTISNMFACLGLKNSIQGLSSTASPQVRKSTSPQSPQNQHIYRHRQKEKELDFSISFVVPVRGRICGGTDLDRWKRSLLVSVLLNCTVVRIAECYVYVQHTTSMLYNAIWYGFCRVTITRRLRRLKSRDYSPDTAEYWWWHGISFA